MSSTILSVASWAMAFSGPFFLKRLEPDYLSRTDEYMALADYDAYVACQEEVGRAFRDEERWARMSILNVARMGRFSSDRTIREYCREIWKIEPVRIP